MARPHLLIAAAVAALPFPAFAGITVLGSSAARMCYLAAESPLVPRVEDLSRCDEALATQTIGRDRVATFVNRGILRQRRNDFIGAIADFDQALRLDSSEPEAYLNRGSVLLRLEQADQAAAMFSRALQYNTRKPALAHFGRAIANELLGDARAAYADYRRASELDPEWDDPREELQRFRVIPASQTDRG